jgi:hypothetical protein
VGRTGYFGGQAGGPRTTRHYADETDQQTLEIDMVQLIIGTLELTPAP